MYVCDHRYRHLHTLEGPVELVCKLNHCPDARCPGHSKTTSPEVEASIAPPHWAIGWDVFCWIWIFTGSLTLGDSPNPRRTHRCSQDQTLRRGHQQLPPSLPGHAGLGAQQDPAALRQQYARVDESIYDRRSTTREGTRDLVRREGADPRKRVWFAEPLLSATADEVRRRSKRPKSGPSY